MDSRGETSGVLRVVEKAVGLTRRGVLTPREAVNKITDELAHYRRGDLAEAVLPLLSPELSSELRTWVEEVLQPGYRYRCFRLGEPPPEDERLRMQAELVSLALRLQHWAIASAADGHRNDAATV